MRAQVETPHAAPFPTPYAVKYGANNDLGAFPGQKSGLTPIIRGGLGSALLSMTPNSVNAIRTSECFQKQTLFDFTTQELVDLDVISSRALKQSNIEASAVPFWGRENWFDEPKSRSGEIKTYALPGNHLPSDNPAGKWLASNDDVYAVLRPCTTLASKMLTQDPHVVNFINHLVHCTPQTVEPNRKPRWNRNRPDSKDKNELTSLDVTNVIIDQPWLKAGRESLYRDLQSILLLAFKVKREDPISGQAADPTTDSAIDAWTEADYDPDTKALKSIYIFIDCELLAPLLGNDLNDGERFGLTYWIATTLLHESIHALWHVINAKETKRIGGLGLYAHIEPYIDEDPLMELGLAMEARALGGHLKPMWDKRPRPTFGYWVETGFPTTNDIARRIEGSAILKDPKLSTSVRAHPVPVGYFEAVHQEDFWCLLLRSGATMLETGVLRQGAEHTVILDRRVKGSGLRTTEENKGMLGLHRSFDISLNKRSKYFLLLTPDERRSFKLGQAVHQSLVAIERYYESTLQIEPLTDQFVAKGKEIALMEDGWKDKTLAVQQAEAKSIWAPLLREQITIVRNALITHEVRLAALKDFEISQNIQDLGRRTMLAAWNYDTRVFIRKVKKLLRANRLPDDVLPPHDPIVIAELEQMDFGLEITRVQVWDFSTADPKCRDSMEYNQLLQLTEFWDKMQASNTTEIMLGICTAMLSELDRGHSLYFPLCIQIFWAYVVAMANETMYFATAKRLLQELEADFTSLQNPQVQTHWIQTLEQWDGLRRQAELIIDVGIAKMPAV